MQRGTAFLMDAQLEEAAACFRQALQENPQDADAHFALGIVFNEQGQKDEASKALEAAIRCDPKLVDAHHMLGAILLEQGDLKGAIQKFKDAIEIKDDFDLAYRDLCRALFQDGQHESAKQAVLKGIALNPSIPDFHNYLGNLHFSANEFSQAAACYRTALSIDPELAPAYANLGNSLLALGKPDEAAPYYKNALSRNPKNLHANLTLGKILLDQGDKAGAAPCYRNALAIDNNLTDAHQYLGNILVSEGKIEEAVACYRQVERLDPANDGIRHLIAALTGQSPERGSPYYVERLFDDYAGHFDSHLVKKLGYQAPEKFVEMICQVSTVGDRKWDVLDLGCGTGLVGLAIAPYANQIVGVDLSPKMLEKARERALYARLAHADLLAMMQGESASSYDVVIAADVFVYVGKLEEIFAEAKRLLRLGGLFVFSVESLEHSIEQGVETNTPGFRLASTARFQHSCDYLEKLAAGNGFTNVEKLLTHVRTDKDKPIPAWFTLWRAG